MTIQFLQQADGFFWSLLIAAILTLFWIISAIREEHKLLILISIRICVFAILLFLLLQPKLSWIDHYEFPLRWNIYADRSVSMGYHQSLSSDSYIESVNSFFSEAEIKDSETQNYYFDHKIYKPDETTVVLSGEATDLGKVIDHIDETESALNGAIIITDGQITKGEQKQSKLKHLSIPIFTVGVGDTIPLVDVAIQLIEAPTVVIKGEEMDVNVTLASHGRINDRVNILLYRGKKLIGSKNVQLHGDGSLTNARFKVTPQLLGENDYFIKTSVLADEININNNSQRFLVTVLKDRYKVALITGSPNFNTGPLKKIIKEIPRVELDHFVQQGEKFIPSINEFWSNSHELIVFENFPLSPISKRWKQILAKKIVSQSSSLFMFAGPNTNKKSIESLYPFFHVQSSQDTFDDSKHKQWIWSSESGIFHQISSEMITANVEADLFPPLYPKIMIDPEDNISGLAYYENSTIPLLVSGEVDGLRSGVWTSSEFSTLYYKMTESDHHNISISLLHNLFSWLLRTSGENELYFRINKDIYQQGEEIHIVGSPYGQIGKDLSSITGYISLKSKNNSLATYELLFNPMNEQWETKFLAGKPGLYNYEIILQDKNNQSIQSGSFIIDESQIELNQVSLNKTILQSISSLTNGKYIPWESRAELLNNIYTNHKQEMLIKSARLTENITAIIILILILSIEWYIRRLIGLT